MIVQCAQCQARFRIRDEKVTEAGVKVRCSKCQYRFRVRRNGTEAEAIPLEEGGASENTSQSHAGARALNVSDDLSSDDIQSEVRTSPGTYLPPEIAQALALARSQGEDEDGVFSAKTVVAPLSGAASQLLAKARNKAPAPSTPDALGASPEAAPSVGRESFDPFSTGPGIEAPKPDSGFRPMGIVPPAPPQPSASEPEGSGEFDPFADAPAPPPPMAAPVAASPEGDFDFGSNLNLGQQSGVYEMPAPSLEAAALAPALGGEDSKMADPFALDTPPPPAPQIDLEASLADADPAAAAPGGEDPLLSEAEFNDPFADPEAALSGPGYPPSSPESENDPFQNLEPQPEAILETQPMDSAADLLPDLPPPEPTQAPGVRSRPPAPFSPRQEGEHRHDARAPLSNISPDPLAKNLWLPDAFGAHRSKATASVLAVTLLVVGFVALVYRNDGRLLGMFSRQPVDATASTSLVALDVSNGLYQTSAGRPVFYVRGVIENRGSQATRAQVRADLLEGSELVSRSEAFAGAALSPEDLYALSATADLEQLLARLEKDALPISPGARADFVVPFFDYPPDLSSFRLRVTAKEVNAASASVQ